MGNLGDRIAIFSWLLGFGKWKGGWSQGWLDACMVGTYINMRNTRLAKRECSQPPIWCDLKIRKNFSLKSATYIEIYRIKIWKDFMGIYSYNSTGGWLFSTHSIWGSSLSCFRDTSICLHQTPYQNNLLPVPALD